MALNLDKTLKLYYSISEVAKMFDVKPKTSGPSLIRQYAEKDIEVVKAIYNLVKVRGFKIAAAKKILAANRKGVDKTTEVLERLIAIRDELQLMKQHVDEMYV